MKKVLIVGAGLMTRPMVDYFIDQCGYEVTMANRTLSKAEQVINGREAGKAVHWTPDNPDVLDKLVAESDIVISMVPKPIHKYVAAPCLKNRKSMLTSSYEIPELTSLHEEAKEKGILILNELGEVPGIDHFGTQMMLDEIKQNGGRVISLNSYGSNIPAFDSNNNPMGYKFAWDPRTFVMAAQTAAAYLEKGRKIVVPGDKLFENPWLVEIEGLGTFEAYPNKDVERYVEPFGLDEGVSFYRGLLRHPGYCDNMRHMITLGLFSDDHINDYKGKTYREFIASLIGVESNGNLEDAVAQHLNLSNDARIIHNLRWLGFFDDTEVAITNGTVLDVVLERMVAKMSYEPHERDMVIVHIDALAEYPGGHKERKLATMHAEGPQSGGDSAISEAVALPVAISTKMILEGRIKATGALMPPTLPELYQPVLEELSTFGYNFRR